MFKALIGSYESQRGMSMGAKLVTNVYATARSSIIINLRKKLQLKVQLKVSAATAVPFSEVRGYQCTKIVSILRYYTNGWKG